MDRSTHYPSEAHRAIAILGGPVQAARLLDVPNHRYQTVQSWLKTRVPAEYCPVIEKLTRELGDEVRCESIRSDVEWGVLRSTARAS
jgi:DNA-binding transcriptional regulator YdaS (Cro superfamily)